MSTLSKLTGGDASHNAGILGKNSLQQQQIANQYGNQGAGVYQGLQQQGNAQVGTYNQDYLNLLSKAGSFAGLGNNLLNPGPPPGADPTQRTLTGQQNASLNQNLYPGSSIPGGGGAQGQDTNNPYSLDSNQQALLNQQIQGLSQQKQQALAQTQQILSQQGITGGPALAAAQQTIDSHFADLQAKTQVGFYEQIKQDKQQALQQIIQEIAGYGQQGIGEQEAAGSGFVGLQSAAQGAQGSLQQQSLQQQNLSNEQLSGLFQLLGFGFGGGFGGAGSVPAAPSLAGIGGAAGGASGAAGISGISAGALGFGV